MNWVTELFGAAALERIEKTLKRMEKKMSEQEQQLDAALADHGVKLDALKTAVDALIAAIPAGVDLSDEIAAVQSASAEVGDITGTVTGATPGE